MNINATKDINERIVKAGRELYAHGLVKGTSGNIRAWCYCPIFWAQMAHSSAVMRVLTPGVWHYYGMESRSILITLVAGILIDPIYNSIPLRRLR